MANHDMDEKAKVILGHYKDKIENRTFDEYDIFGFLIFIRSYIKGCKTIKEFANLVAHRNRDRGRVMSSIEAAIKNNYELKEETKEVDGVNGIRYQDWEQEWIRLSEEFDIELTSKIIYELTLCIFSIAQFTEYESKYQSYSGRIEIIKSENAMQLLTTEGKTGSPFICFFSVGTKQIEGEKFFPVLNPIEVIRVDGELEIRQI